MTDDIEKLDFRSILKILQNVLTRNTDFKANMCYKMFVEVSDIF